jgi:hypothetical protein
MERFTGVLARQVLKFGGQDGSIANGDGQSSRGDDSGQEEQEEDVIFNTATHR